MSTRLQPRRLPENRPTTHVSTPSLKNEHFGAGDVFATPLSFGAREERGSFHGKDFGERNVRTVINDSSAHIVSSARVEGEQDVIKNSNFERNNSNNEGISVLIQPEPFSLLPSTTATPNIDNSNATSLLLQRLSSLTARKKSDNELKNDSESNSNGLVDHFDMMDEEQNEKQKKKKSSSNRSSDGNGDDADKMPVEREIFAPARKKEIQKDKEISASSLRRGLDGAVFPEIWTSSRTSATAAVAASVAVGISNTTANTTTDSHPAELDRGFFLSSIGNFGMRQQQQQQQQQPSSALTAVANLAGYEADLASLQVRLQQIHSVLEERQTAEATLQQKREMEEAALQSSFSHICTMHALSRQHATSLATGMIGSINSDKNSNHANGVVGTLFPRTTFASSSSSNSIREIGASSSPSSSFARRLGTGSSALSSLLAHTSASSPRGSVSLHRQSEMLHHQTSPPSAFDINDEILEQERALAVLGKLADAEKRKLEEFRRLSRQRSLVFPGDTYGDILLSGEDQRVSESRYNNNNFYVHNSSRAENEGGQDSSDATMKWKHRNYQLPNNNDKKQHHKNNRPLDILEAMDNGDEGEEKQRTENKPYQRKNDLRVEEHPRMQELDDASFLSQELATFREQQDHLRQELAALTATREMPSPAKEDNESKKKTIASSSSSSIIKQHLAARFSDVENHVWPSKK